jgi:hypothetical protein
MIDAFIAGPLPSFLGAVACEAVSLWICEGERNTNQGRGKAEKLPAALIDEWSLTALG